jgi:hypothetical protein
MALLSITTVGLLALILIVALSFVGKRDRLLPKGTDDS